MIRILVTGAAGFVGSHLVQALLREPAFADGSIVLFDKDYYHRCIDSRVRIVRGDLQDRQALASALSPRPDIVFQLAGVLGGTAESNYSLARAVNIDATLSLFELLRNADKPPRVIFASSIAVFGPMPPDVVVTDDTHATPRMVYGAQKRMMEIALDNFSVRGDIDGIALRLPGIVARPDADQRMKSSYMHRLFYAFKLGHDCTVPVGPEGTSWLISVRACVDALIHAALLPRAWDGSQRVFMLPAQRVSMQQLVDGLAMAFPGSRTNIHFAPEPELEAQFARQPPLVTATADRLGFQHDGSIARLIRRATEPLDILSRSPSDGPGA